jgi:hypothetical protein
VYVPIFSKIWWIRSSRLESFIVVRKPICRSFHLQSTEDVTAEEKESGMAQGGGPDGNERGDPGILRCDGLTANCGSMPGRLVGLSAAAEDAGGGRNGRDGVEDRGGSPLG